MPTGDRVEVVPSRANQVIIKQKLKSATYGLALLKRKRDALQMKLREVTEQLVTREGSLRNLMAQAYIDMAKAKFLCYDLNLIPISDCESSDLRLRLKYSSVVGVKLPSFELLDSAHDSYPLSGLARGGQQITHIRHSFNQVLVFAAELASLQYSWKVLQKSVQDSSMRVNGLELVLIPRFENTLLYIADELDEMEREDIYKIKMSKAKHMRKL